MAGILFFLLRCEHNFLDLDGVALRIDEVQVINAIAAPVAEADVGLLLVDGRFIDNRLPEGVGNFVFPALHAAEVASIEGDGGVTRIGPNF